MGDVEPDYTDPLEAFVVAELIDFCPGINREGARAGAHVLVSGVDAAAGTAWRPRALSFRRAQSRLIESADRVIAAAVQTLGGKPSTVHLRRRNRLTVGLEKLDTDELARRAAGTVRAVDPPPQTTVYGR